MNTIFRTRVIQQESTPEKPAEVTGKVEDPSKLEILEKNPSDLDNWETINGKYGLEYLGIKEIGNEFPLKMHFSVLDKYIKEQLTERGYDKTPAKWQEVLKELEDEIGSSKLNSIERLKKLAGLINIIRKQNSLKAKRKLYNFISDTPSEIL